MSSGWMGMAIRSEDIFTFAYFPAASRRLI
jgi:hypothetical protein